jgi:type II secretory pathway pseudopilin PulG
MRRAKTRARGTTLTEAVVVVAMVGLLAVMIGPSLDPVREESRVATCLANLRVITQAAAGYTAENGTLAFVFPFGYETATGVPECPPNFVTEFIWGGGLPDKAASEWDEGQGTGPLDFDTDVYSYLESERPLNDYLYPGVPWCDPERRCRSNPLRRDRPMQLPDLFKCPSDSTAAIPTAGGPDIVELPETPIPSWEWWGTSYPINWYWAYYYALYSNIPFIGTVSHPGALDGPLHTEILASKSDRGASEWILFMENRLNFAFNGAVPRGYIPPEEPPRSLQAWHGQQDVHVAGFADGSARYQYFDMRYVDGPGWTLWPNRPWEGPWEQYQDH